MDNSEMTKQVTPTNIDPEIHHADYIHVPPGKVWRQHHTQDLELVMVVRGNFRASDPDHDKTDLTPGDVVFVRPGYPCDIEQAEDAGGMVSCIHFELLHEKRWGADDYRIDPFEPWVIQTGANGELIDLFQQCAREFMGAGLYRAELMSVIFRQIWLRLMRHVSGSGSDERSSRMQAMLVYLRRNAIAGAGRRELAREFHLTPEYVNQLFREYVGMSPGEVVQRERVSRAVQLLTQGKYSVTEVAFRVGFSDPQYFSRVFQQIMRRPPSSYL